MAPVTTLFEWSSVISKMKWNANELRSKAFVSKGSLQTEIVTLEEFLSSYQKTFSCLMMLDSMTNLFTQPEVSFAARLRALPQVVLTVLHRLTDVLAEIGGFFLNAVPKKRWLTP